MKKEIEKLIEKYRQRGEDSLNKYYKYNNSYYAGQQAICDNVIANLEEILNSEPEK